MRLAIRGFGNGRKVFEDFFDGDLPDLATLAETHAARLLAYRTHMIEIEFLDEPNPFERFFRMGTDPARMVRPIAIDLTRRPKPD